MIKALVCVPAIFFLSITVSAFSQQATADLRGFVTDKSGAAVVEAHVTLTNPQTGLQRSSQTLGTGAFAFVAIPAGGYKLLIEKPGFAAKLVEGITLTVGQTASLDVLVDVGSVAQTTNVSSDPPVVDTTQSYIGTTIGTREVRDLPSNRVSLPILRSSRQA
ncbi:carboxypeptidase-like regulatory domain-containing protein [Tunturiibacter gelidiferens]|uniref:carboxypeptidase-like regulatory domain-containing protein n=1 Tax=Tunturiibacter gelidiferens TaxID=3069689 RepID=UPI003D9AE65D